MASPKSPGSSESGKRLERRLQAVRAGSLLHVKHPGHAKTAGAAGGRACVNKHPFMRSSDWGRALARARELKRALARAQVGER